MLFRDKMKIRSQRGWRVRELMANQRCFEKKGNFIFLPSKAHGNVGKCHLKMNPSHSHFLLVLKDSVISVQIAQLIRDFNFQLCTFILKLLKVELIFFVEPGSKSQSQSLSSQVSQSHLKVTT